MAPALTRRSKHANTNRSHRSHIHYRAPSKIFWRTVRGMLPHRTARGTAALERLSVFDGVPPPFDRRKRMVVPEALKVLRLKPGRRNCQLKQVSGLFGWKYGALVEELEGKRQTRAAAWHKERAEKAAKVAKLHAASDKQNAAASKVIAEFGF